MSTSCGPEPVTPEKNHNNKQIRYRNGAIDHDLCRRLAAELDVPYVLAVLLCRRGMTTARAATTFLYPSLGDLPSPFLLKDMDKAVSLVITAFHEKWPVVIHGDYDLDGISSTALLARFFRSLSIRAVCHLPDRLTEGYGINKQSIARLAPGGGGPALLITVDCGITAVEEVAFAREKGFRVIVTDHHEPPASLPPADAILNPKQEDCSFPFPELAGVGVAFYLAMGVRSRLVEQGVWNKETAPNLRQFLDFVALGTVADVVPLLGLNRILVRAGLEVLTERSSPGIRALSERARTMEGRITAEDISYRLAPRLNAAGRLGKPGLALELLTCSEPAKARQLAGRLELINQERRQMETEALGLVMDQCARQEDEGRAGFVAYGNYHLGIIGIIAARSVEKYGKPVFVLTDEVAGDQGLLKGSGRSIKGINLYEVLQQCAETTVQFGGHAMAAGLTLHKSKLNGFAATFDRVVAATGKTEQPDNERLIDYLPTTAEIFDEHFIGLYHNLEPFGQGNPEPVFCLENQKIESSHTLRNHLKYSIRHNGHLFNGIGFGLADRIEYTRDKPVQLTFTIKHSTFRGEQRLELHAVSIDPTA